MHSGVPDVGEDVSGEDLLTVGEPIVGRCPVCDCVMHPPEYRYDDDGVKCLDGPSNYWCPCCGYEDPIRAEEDDDDVPD